MKRKQKWNELYYLLYIYQNFDLLHYSSFILIMYTWVYFFSECSEIELALPQREKNALSFWRCWENKGQQWPFWIQLIIA